MQYPGSAISLPLTIGVLRHHARREGGWNGGWRGRQAHSGIWIDYRNGIASAQCRRLVEFHLMTAVGLVAGNGIVGIIRGSGRKGEAWRGLLLGLDVRLERR